MNGIGAAVVMASATGQDGVIEMVTNQVAQVLQVNARRSLDFILSVIEAICGF